MLRAEKGWGAKRLVAEFSREKTDLLLLQHACYIYTQDWCDWICGPQTGSGRRRTARTENVTRVEDHLKEKNDWLKTGVVLIRTLLTEQWISDVIDSVNVSARKVTLKSIYTRRQKAKSHYRRRSLNEQMFQQLFELFVVFYRSQRSRQTVPDSWAGDCERSITEPCPWYRTREGDSWT